MMVMMMICLWFHPALKETPQGEDHDCCRYFFGLLLVCIGEVQFINAAITINPDPVLFFFFFFFFTGGWH